jgi:hypothetical protein
LIHSIPYSLAGTLLTEKRISNIDARHSSHDLQIMDKFGPIDDQAVEMDEDEAASFLADEGFQVVSNKKTH